MRYISFVTLLVLTSVQFAQADNNKLIVTQGQKENVEGIIQSRFVGPTQLKVWRHWQPSWNVENVTSNPQFEFIRALGNDSKPYVLLRFRSSQLNLKAQIQSKTIERAAEWEVKPVTNSSMESQGKVQNGWNEFEFRNADSFYDVNEKRVVTNIEFKIFQNGSAIYTFELTPMYVRGKDTSYWNNNIDPVSAHGGFGMIQVSTLLNLGTGWDTWQGTKVRPVLDYIERNTLAKNTEIGLHRHEQNQEIWFVEQGTFIVLSGVAVKSSGSRRVSRKWDAKGQMTETDEYEASGGWIESRYLTPGHLFTIVPSSTQPNIIYSHGVKSTGEGGIFWTMGAKN